VTVNAHKAATDPSAGIDHLRVRKESIMFDKLVESSKQNRDGRTKKAFLVTSLLYLGAITTLCITTIVWFNPAMADVVSVGVLTPPSVPVSPPPSAPQIVRNTVANPNVIPTVIPKTIPDPITVPPRAHNRDYVIGAVGPVGNTNGSPNMNYVPDLGGDGLPPPEPPPVVKAVPTPSPAPAPTPKPITKVSEGVLVGKALHRQSPAYPAIAKAARVQGVVKVQILIDEDGQVISASAIEGHPLLRDASVQAARQWRFSPTLLSKEPVKVQGILSFNFTLGQ
jgi:protein TonB